MGDGEEEDARNTLEAQQSVSCNGEGLSSESALLAARAG